MLTARLLLVPLLRTSRTVYCRPLCSKQGQLYFLQERFCSLEFTSVVPVLCMWPHSRALRHTNSCWVERDKHGSRDDSRITPVCVNKDVSPDEVAWDGGVVSERGIRNVAECSSDYSFFEALCRLWLEGLTKGLRMAGLQTEIWTQDLLNA